MTHIAYIGIGSNLGDRKKNCTHAVAQISRHAKISVTKIASWIETRPIGVTDQPNFINGGIKLSTDLTPQALLKFLKRIERGMGRKKKSIKWGPRVIDLDIWLYDNISLKTPNLTIPHPEIKNREFVRIPLKELNPALVF